MCGAQVNVGGSIYGVFERCRTEIYGCFNGLTSPQVIYRAAIALEEQLES